MMQSFFLTDEELGKKDDDHKTSSKPVLRPGTWTPARAPPRKSLKRLAIALLVGAAIYLFIKNIPTDIGPRDHRRPTYYHPGDDSDLKPRPPPEKPPPPRGGKGPKPQAAAETKDHSYNGPLRFLNLAASLHGIMGTRGGLVTNKNVLFAVSSLKSAATLLPLACQMGVERNNYVHFALMSRSEIDIEQLGKINGIDESCHVIFHDARPDLSEISTIDRLESSTARAMYHIHMYMHPQAVFIDGSDTEEVFFIKGMRRQAGSLDMPLIELPHNSAKELSWLTRLDASSLAAWNKVSLDILIHAPPDASGSLIRLLRSLSSAAFTAGSIPHLTIELPQKIDPPTEKFLETFKWPPSRVQSPNNARLLSLRHRIPKHGVSEDESSARFLESFWPVHPQHSHVLVLSPQVEVSSHFFNYLKYAVLHYRYSDAAAIQQWDERLFGVSLDLPSTSLDGSTPFSAPLYLDQLQSTKSNPEEAVSFLWEAPNSNAMLFLGERWVEMHKFVSQSLEVQQTFSQTPPLLEQKAVSKKYPAWLEQALRLSRARGYWTLYPGKTTAGKLATIHTELNTPPEEYDTELQGDKDHADEIDLVPGSLLEHLPKGGVLAPFSALPLVAWGGKEADLNALDSASLAYALAFRQQVGGCDSETTKEQTRHRFAEDLFCSKDGKGIKAEAKSSTELESKAAPEAVPQVEPKSEPKPESKPESKPELKEGKQDPI